MVFSQIDCKKPREFGVMENTTDSLCMFSCMVNTLSYLTSNSHHMLLPVYRYVLLAEYPPGACSVLVLT